MYRPAILCIAMITLAIVATACDNTPNSPATSTVVTSTAVTSAPIEGKIDVGGYKLFYSCEGYGSPTVIMDAGLGESSSTWDSVRPETAKFARVCVYDRANLGRSEPGPSPRTAAQIVKELHTLLTNAKIDGPYVLVGHSQGGLHMLLYAKQYPKETAGLVLVDAALPDSEVGFEAVLSRSQLEERKSLFKNNRENMTYEDVRTSGEQVKAAGSLPDVPLAVLRHGRMLEYPSGWPVEKIEQMWQGLQEDLVKGNSKGKLIVAEKSGHFIQDDQPDLVISAVQAVVDEARGK